MLFLLAALAFVLLLTGLILIHEFGHFIAARKSGVTVEEFGFGLPPRAKTLFHWMGTRFSLNWIPFGGFVRLKGENAVTESERRVKGSFASAPLLSRCLILVAGVGMNFALALLLFCMGFSFGRWIPTYPTFAEVESAVQRKEISANIGVLISDVLPEGTAAAAGVPKKSRLVSIDGEKVETEKDVVRLQQGKKSVTYVIKTGPPDFTETETIRIPVREGMTGVSVQRFAWNMQAPVRGFGEAFLLSLRESWVVMVQTIYGLGALVASLLTRGTVPEGITGIVGIARFTYGSVRVGLSAYVELVAKLSLSLAALNILPIPALDGGRLLFVLLESLNRRPVMRRIEVFANTAGFTLLLLLILLVTFYDVLRLFS